MWQLVSLGCAGGSSVRFGMALALGSLCFGQGVTGQENTAVKESSQPVGFLPQSLAVWGVWGLALLQYLLYFTWCLSAPAQLLEGLLGDPLAVLEQQLGSALILCACKPCPLTWHSGLLQGPDARILG